MAEILFVYAALALKQLEKLKKNYWVINSCFKQSVESVRRRERRGTPRPYNYVMHKAIP
jgi:hypothetical protein